jgi:hypothetical protein
MSTQDTQFVKALQDRIEWHRNNTYDPYNIGNAAILILSEVKAAFVESRQKAATADRKGGERK